MREYGVDRALEIEVSTADEFQWTGLKGEPIDPDHAWWDYQGMSDMKARGRSEGVCPPASVTHRQR